MRSFPPVVQSVAILALAAWAVFFTVDIFPGLFWAPGADFGLATDTNLVVVSIDPLTPGTRSPAGAAGIHVGDRLDAVGISFAERLYLLRVHLPAPGTSMHLSVYRGARSFSVRMTARQATPDPSLVSFYVLNGLIGLVFTAIGASLVYYRPGWMSWGFFLGTIGLQQGLFFATYWLPAIVAYISTIFGTFLWAAGYAGLLVFVDRVPDDRATRLSPLIAPLAAVTFILLFGASLSSLWLSGVPNDLIEISNKVVSFLPWLWVCLAGTLFLRAFQAHGRQRIWIAWIACGFTVGFGARELGNISTLPDALEAIWLPALQTALPLSVAYALVRHHAFRGGFTVNRAVVYTLFLSSIFCVLALADYGATRATVNSQMKIGMLVALAALFGFAAPSLHRRAVRLIDRVLLPLRYERTGALEALQSQAEHSRRSGTPAPRLPHAIAGALGVTSLAFFKRCADGGFVRYADAGWEKPALWHLLPSDPLPTTLRSGEILQFPNLAGDEHCWPSGTARPSMAITLSRKHCVEHLIFLGSATRESKPDRDSLRILASLARTLALLEE